MPNSVRATSRSVFGAKGTAVASSSPLGVREITRVELVTPYANRLSPELQTLVDTDRIKLRLGTEYLIELGFDGEGKGQQLDLRSELPLILSW